MDIDSPHHREGQLVLIETLLQQLSYHIWLHFSAMFYIPRCSVLDSRGLFSMQEKGVFLFIIAHLCGCVGSLLGIQLGKPSCIILKLLEHPKIQYWILFKYHLLFVSLSIMRCSYDVPNLHFHMRSRRVISCEFSPRYAHLNYVFIC